MCISVAPIGLFIRTAIDGNGGGCLLPFGHVHLAMGQNRA